MKHYLTIVLLFVAAAVFGQSGTIPVSQLQDPFSLSYRDISITADVTVSTTDTTWGELQELRYDSRRGSLLGGQGAIVTIPERNYVTANTWQVHQSFDSVYSTYDTTALNAGKSKCDHSWVDKRNNVRISTCLVYHGQTGCPDTWLDKERICSLCLRYEHIRESRGVIRLVPPVTFEELKARIK